MNHAAIDLGGKESQICIRQPDGTIIEERKVPTRKLTELVATWAPSRVVMETSAEAFRIADAAIAAGHQVRVVPGTLVRLLGVGERGIKNDQRDAQQLSKASWQTDVPSVHIPSQPARELKSICGARDVLVGREPSSSTTCGDGCGRSCGSCETGRRQRSQIECAGMPHRWARSCPSTSSDNSGCWRWWSRR